jgi:GTP cyclohydrolase II
VDARDDKVAAKIITLLKIRSLSLITNNPDKIEKLKKEKIEAVGRIPIVIPANGHDAASLDVKKKKMGHIL